MLAILAPSKTLAEEPALCPCKCTSPELLSDAKLLAGRLKKLSAGELGKLMEISPKLADLNHERFRRFSTPFTGKNATPALLTFKGDVYQGIPVEEYSKSDLEFANKHVRILSGLYGVLRPLDLMQPYRLEMGAALKNERGTDLYAFWGDKVAKVLTKALLAQGDDLLINLTSQEYFKAVDTKRLKGRVIDVAFKEVKNGKSRTVALFVKQARGHMANFIVQQRAKTPNDLKAFKAEGYQFSAKESASESLVFLRKGA